MTFERIFINVLYQQLCVSHADLKMHFPSFSLLSGCQSRGKHFIPNNQYLSGADSAHAGSHDTKGRLRSWFFYFFWGGEPGGVARNAGFELCC